ncbi:TipJ family phage tail tip protein [Escherichia coli]|uniref:TipJ family phage tail tip protein n=1 Tax=Escherichia coli TaxID=562 RepID=UPI003D9BBDB9
MTRTITSANIDRLRFTFGVQALVETTSKGDRNPSEVRLLVQIQVIHRNHRCETVLPEHGTGRRTGGFGAVRQPAGEP